MNRKNTWKVDWYWENWTVGFWWYPAKPTPYFHVDLLCLELQWGR